MRDNITSLTKGIRKALNRERSNVGRTAYSDRVKSILLACTSTTVAKRLVEGLRGYETGALHDEPAWTDVSVHACQLLNVAEKVVFLTPTELISAMEVVDRARADDYDIVTVPESIERKTKGMLDVSGNAIMDIEQFRTEWNRSFSFYFVDENHLTPNELRVLRMTDNILALAGGKPPQVKRVRMSETMRLDPSSLREAEGLGDEATGAIIIKRDQLRTLEDYAGTLLHETAHAGTGVSDVCRELEEELTRLLGTIVGNTLS
jgi:hypothetical protein